MRFARTLSLRLSVNFLRQSLFARISGWTQAEETASAACPASGQTGTAATEDGVAAADNSACADVTPRLAELPLHLVCVNE